MSGNHLKREGARRTAGFILAGLVPAWAAIAHVGPHESDFDPWTAWNWDLWVLVPLLLSGWLYARGIGRLWGSARVGSGVRRWQAAAFGIGWITLALALHSPLDHFGGILFWAHMVQHELLMLVAAPLLVLGKPLVAFLWAVPMSWRRALGGAAQQGWWRAVWQFLTHPLAAWALFAIVLWGWHVPDLYQAALENIAVHILQHVSFLVVSLLFWWVVFQGRRSPGGHGAAVIVVFTTALHSGILGALLTFAPTVWYPAYGGAAAAWGLTPLEDQQLAGLIMWVPAGVVYLIAVLALCADWLQESDRRARGRDAALWAEPR